jgi:hypothetical protein
LRPMSRRSARCWAMPIDRSRCAITASGPVDPIERKSVEPMAAVTAPAQVAEASILASFCGQRTVVGRCDAGQGGQACVAGDRA